jgi:hypothetical protein
MLADENNLRFRRDFADSPSGLDAAYAGQTDVQEHQVRLKLFRFLHCLFTAYRLTDHVQGRIIGQKRTDHSSDHGVIIHDKNLNNGHCSHKARATRIYGKSSEILVAYPETCIQPPSNVPPVDLAGATTRPAVHFFSTGNPYDDSGYAANASQTSTYSSSTRGFTISVLVIYLHCCRHDGYGK